MRFLLLFGFGLCLYHLATAAPQDLSVNENTVEEESNVATAEVATGVQDEATTKKSSEKESPETLGIKEETDSSVQETSDGGQLGTQSLTEVQELTVDKGESEPTKETSSGKPEDTIVTQATVTEKPISVTTSTAKPTKKPVTTSTARPTKKPVRKTTAKPLAEENPTPVTPSPSPVNRYPCRCGGGICSCCTGVILENFNVPIRSRACANVSYEPEDFAFNFKLLFNNRVLYNTRMSAKNPRPVCIPINRFFGIKMCARMSNVYMSGRNIHACLEMEGYWDEESAFKYSFNCFRIGSNGIAVVRPEDGGGLPPPPDEEEQTDEDYDDSARSWNNADENVDSTSGWVGDVETVQN